MPDIDANRNTAPGGDPARHDTPGRLRVLFFVEGFTDIRFVTGLSAICDLTMVVAAGPYRESGLHGRVEKSGACLRVVEVAGGRIRFQLASLGPLWREVAGADVILSQEVSRGSLNANLVGRLRGVPVVTYLGIAPVEYFRCRRERRRIGPIFALAGETLIRLLMGINGRLAARCLAMGPYLRDVAGRACARTDVGLYYGVDVDHFRPAEEVERTRLRRALNLPDRFLIVLSSRISHEKDPETVLRAVAQARSQGLDAVVLNLGGGYREFLSLATSLQLEGEASTPAWVLGRPAVHPMDGLADYFRAADVVALASLAEGAAFSTLEALACETPVVATAVGGMAVQLRGHAWLTPRRDPAAMAGAFLSIAGDGGGARRLARSGREYVCREWSRRRAFTDLERALRESSRDRRGLASRPRRRATDLVTSDAVPKP